MNAEKFTKKSLEAIENCQKQAMEYGNQEIKAEHILYSLLTIEDSLIVKLLTKMNIDTEAMTKDAETAVAKLPKVGGSNSDLYMGTDAGRVVMKAEDEAKKMGDAYISVEHLFLGLLDSPNDAVKQIFKKYSILKLNAV